YPPPNSGIGQAITRSPDVTGGFVAHSSAPGGEGRLFSPGARSNGIPFTTTDPVIISITPNAAIVGRGEVEILITGSNFQSGSQVRLDGSPISATFVSDAELVALIPSFITDAAGSHSVTVRNPNLAVSNPVTFTVLGAIGINEFLADPPDGAAGDANGDGVRDSSQDEFIEVINRTSGPVNVGGFSVGDLDAVRFTFPPGAIIPAGEAAVIFGGGSPRGEFGNARANGLVFTASLSLNNSGDAITIKDGSARAVESIAYGSGEGNANQSINRNPDGEGTTFAPHSSIAGSGGRLFSPGARTSGSPFTVGPRIARITPDRAPGGAASFDMSVQGSGFEATSSVFIDVTPVETSFVSPGELVARVPASVTAIGGDHAVEVRNEGGNRSNAVMLNIIPPPPSILSLVPRLVLVGSGSFTLFVAGENFVASSTVLIEDSPLSTVFISARELRASVPASFLAAVGVRRVRVRNADGRQSGVSFLEVVLPSAQVTSVSPAQAIVGGPPFTLTVAGRNFKSGATVLFDQTPLETRFISATELRAVVSATLLTGVGLRAVSVQNIDGAISNEAIFRIAPDPPLIHSIDPPTVTEGGGESEITIAGEKFQRGALVRVLDAERPGPELDATFINDRRLEARLPAAFTLRAGGVSLRVENPDFGVSNAVTLKVLIKDPLVINEYLADPPEGLQGDANGDGVRNSSQDEFVEVVNRTAEPIDLSGYRLSDGEQVRHVFAAGTALPPLEALVVFGGGSPSGRFGNAAENQLVLKASSGGLSLNNGGDTIRLEDAQGRTVQEVKFSAAEGGANQSINRDPDADGARFSRHTNVAEDAGRLFSPGTKAKGDAFTIKPVIRSLAPASIRAGSAATTLSISGGNFLPGAVVLFDQARLATAYRSDALLEAEVDAQLVAEGGAVEVRVRNPKGELSTGVKLLIEDDPPRVLRLSPQSTGTGAESLQVTIEGERFQRGAAATVAGAAVETRFISSTSLLATVPGSLFAQAAALEVRVLNADGNQSNGLKLTVENGPLITRLSRSRFKAGRGAVEITIGGIAFKPDVILFVNDSPVATAFVSDTAITARIPGEATSGPGVLTLQARHADGGRSNKVTVKVVN
ncbi:MAG TPA: IPT/TIG domain-containing protein, partial [Blastocatellia bacterium]|nr:IPT/TIG domain-containing protein [Blastocatellia bacterium]